MGLLLNGKNRDAAYMVVVAWARSMFQSHVFPCPTKPLSSAPP